MLHSLLRSLLHSAVHSTVRHALHKPLQRPPRVVLHVHTYKPVRPPPLPRVQRKP